MYLTRRDTRGTQRFLSCAIVGAGRCRGVQREAVLGGAQALGMCELAVLRSLMGSAGAARARRDGAGDGGRGERGERGLALRRASSGVTTLAPLPLSSSSAITPLRRSRRTMHLRVSRSGRVRAICRMSATSALESAGSGWNASSPASFSTNTPSRARVCKWGFSRRSELTRWTAVTAPLLPPTMPSAAMCRRYQPITESTKVWHTAPRARRRRRDARAARKAA